jgi:hypothetical protein
LSDFRWQAAEVADRLLMQGVTALWSEGLITLASLTQDGVRIRAAAGAASFRRLERLKELLAEVSARVAALKREIDADPDASNRRRAAAQLRAAREQEERIAAAVATAAALAGEPATKTASARGEPPAGGGAPESGPAPQEKKKEPRASTTDPQAHVMRMPDGGYRPAYNGQIIGDLDSTMILGVDLDTIGSDGGLMAPAADEIERRYGHRPARWLADGGFAVLDDIVALAAKGITVFCPPKPRRNPKNDPAAPRPGDPPAVAAWRRRMVEDAAAGADSWMRRRGEAELIHANFRNRGLQRFNVRGAFKARTVLLFQALAHNILTALRLRTAAA